MRPLNFNQFPVQVPDASALSQARSVRTIFDAIASRNAPIAPGGDPDGVLLVDIDARQCRFPIRRDARGTRFCAVTVEPEIWRPGKLNGCYCAFHRQFLAGQPRVNEEAC